MLQRYEVQPSEVGKAAAGAEESSAAKAFDGSHSPRRRHQHFPSARLLGISQATLRECLPHLDVGDAFQWIQSQNKSLGPSSYSSGPIADANPANASSPEVAARKTL